MYSIDKESKCHLCLRRGVVSSSYT